MEKEKKFLKKLIIWNSLGIFNTIAFTICMIVFFVAWAKWNTTTNIEYWWEGATTIMTWCLFVAGLIGFIQFILNIVFALQVLTFNWKNQWCKENSKLWGLLSLFVLGWIGIYVFAFVSKKHVNNPKEYEQFNPHIPNNSFLSHNNQYPDYDQNPFTKNNNEQNNHNQPFFENDKK